MRKYRRVGLMILKSDAKFEGKLTLGSKSDMRIWLNFRVQAVAGHWKFSLWKATFAETM